MHGENDSNNSNRRDFKVIGVGITLLTLVFIAYNYFNTKPDMTNATQSTQEAGTIFDQLKEIFTSSDEKAGEIGEMAAEDSMEDVAGMSDERQYTEWIATNYTQGDIQAGTYTVKRGDTLWEIAEAVYGDGTEWHKILEANSESVGYLPNGSQALIITGQTLMIP